MARRQANQGPEENPEDTRFEKFNALLLEFEKRLSNIENKAGANTVYISDPGLQGQIEALSDRAHALEVIVARLRTYAPF